MEIEEGFVLKKIKTDAKFEEVVLLEECLKIHLITERKWCEVGCVSFEYDYIYIEFIYEDEVQFLLKIDNKIVEKFNLDTFYYHKRNKYDQYLLFERMRDD